MERVRTPRLQFENVRRVNAQQQDTYVKPAAPTQDNRLAQLADALGSFSNSLSGFNQVQKAKKNDEAIWAAEKRIAGMTKDEVRKEIQSGQRPSYADPFAEKAHNAASGMKYGQSRSEEIRRHLMTDFNWDQDDPELFIQGEIDKDLELYGQDRNFGNNYVRQMQSLQNWAAGYGEKRLAEDFEEDKRNAAFNFIDVVANHGIEAGSDPEQVASEIFRNYPDLGKDGTLGVDYKDLDQEVLNKARRLSMTNPELAMALITHERPDGNGQMRSFLHNPSMRDTVLQIQANAARVMGERKDASFKQDLYSKDAEMIAAGRGAEIEDMRYTDYKGVESILSADTRRQRAKETFLEQSEKRALAHREAPAERMQRELRALRRSGEKHPELERNLSNIAASASLDVLSDPEAQEQLVQKLQTYKWLRNESTNAVMAYTKKEDREFAETYMVAERYLGQDPETALNTAIRASQVSSEGLPKLSRDDQANLDDKIASAATKPGLIWNSDTVPANAGVVEQSLRKLTTTYMKLGLGPDMAVEAAAESIKASTITYNGAVIDAQGFDIPDNFKEVLDEEMAKFEETSPLTLERSDLSVEDLTVVPAGNGTAHGGRFVVVDKETMTPVHTDEGEMVFMSLNGLRQAATKLAEKKASKASRKAALESSVRARGLKRRPDENGNTVWMDPKTGEIWKPTHGHNDLTPRWKKTGKRVGDKKPRTRLYND